MSKKELQSGISPKYYKPLGKVAVNFEKIDNFVALGIKILLFEFQQWEKQTSELITNKISFDRKVELLKSLYRHRNPPKMMKHKRFEAIIDAIRRAQKCRNNLLHATWMTEGKQKASTIVKTNTKHPENIHFEFETISVKEIEKIANFLDETAQELADFLPIILPPQSA